MTIRNGDILDAKVLNIVRGAKGNPGELVGSIKKENKLGEVKLNTNYGVYGYWDQEKIVDLPEEKFSIGLQDQVHEGPATIKSNIDGNAIEEYDIYIENVNRYSVDDSKGMVIRITDAKLLSKTNGIVQGMSGSPIIQGGKLVGAITHVFVQDPTKGYGIFIESMLKQEKMI
jgi:stage IV sporulation protein B